MAPKSKHAEQKYGDHALLPEDESGISFEVIPREILASDHPWFRRPELINQSIYPNTVYRIGLLEDIREIMQRFRVLDKFEQGPFGHFLKWNPGSNSRKLLNCVISRAIFRDRGIWFHIRGRAVEYTVQDHCLITGLRFGPTQYDPRIARPTSDSQLFETVCSGGNERASWVEERFKMRTTPFYDPEGNVHVKLANVLLANSFLLGRESKRPVCPWLWHLADDEAAFSTFPWGAYTYKTLQYYLRTFHVSGSAYHMYGPAWALMIWALEVIPGLGLTYAEKIDDGEIPRCLRWKFRNTFPGSANSTMYSHFDMQDMASVTIEPNGAEVRTPYFLSVHDPDAMFVRYHVPTDPYITVPGLARPLPQPQAEPQSGYVAPRRSVRFAPASGDDCEGDFRRGGGEASGMGHEGGSMRINPHEFQEQLQGVVSREERRMMTLFKAEVKKTEQRFKAGVMKILTRGIEIVTCGTSTMPTDMYEARPPSPRISVCSRRESDVVYTGVDRDSGFDAQASASLPIYTSSFSGGEAPMSSFMSGSGEEGPLTHEEPRQSNLFEETESNFRDRSLKLFVNMFLKYVPTTDLDYDSLAYAARRVAAVELRMEVEKSSRGPEEKAEIDRMLTSMRPAFNPKFEERKKTLHSRSADEIRAVRNKIPNAVYVEQLLPDDRVDDWVNVREEFIKFFYYWEVYPTPYEMNAFICFMEDRHNALWEYIKSLLGDKFLKPPEKYVLDYPVWDGDLISRETAELLRMKNIDVATFAETYDARRRVCEAYGFNPTQI